MRPSKFFTREQKARIINAIRNAEENTSGEIRVHVERLCPGEPTDRAAYLFEKLGMHKTNLRNGVLFFMSFDNHKIAILGDAGINAVVPDNFWDSTLEMVTDRFREGDFTGGLEAGIANAGIQLKDHFPHRPDDFNELTDEISFGDK
jgi:uncharacterized membrane protein